VTPHPHKMGVKEEVHLLALIFSPNQTDDTDTD
jgi:hypothetical protein